MDAGSSLYDHDFYTWTQEQAAALRRLAGRRVNLEPDLDLPNLIEEVESLRSEQVWSVLSHLQRMLEHLLYVARAPQDSAFNHCLGEILAFRENALRRYRESMRRVVEPRLDREWQAARRIVARKLGSPLPGLPDTCPFTLDELLAEDDDLDTLVARLDQHPTA